MTRPFFLRMLAVTAMLCLPASMAAADLCVLKTGAYTLSNQYNGYETASPCSDADASDGATDGVIHFDYNYAEDISIDVVFQQSKNYDYQGRSVLFMYRLLYDGAGMSSPSCSAGTNGIPGNGTSIFFSSNVIEMTGETQCDNVSGGGSSDPVPAVQQAFFDLNDYFPTSYSNFILDRISFTNSFSPGTDVWTSRFLTMSENDDFATDVYIYIEDTGNVCYMFSGGGECSEYGWPVQNILTTRISITPPEYIAPMPPSNLSSEAGDTTATVSWNSPTLNEDQTPLTDLQGYYVYISDDGESFTKVNDTPVSPRTHTFSGLTNSTQYHVYVTASDFYGNESAHSSETAFIPAAPEISSPPESFSARGAAGSILLSWINPGDSNFDGVVIRRDTSSFPAGPDSGTPLYSGAAESFADMDAATGTTYYYSIFSHNTLGNYSPDSDLTHATATPSDWALTIFTGWNMISLPFTGLDPLPAELAAISGGGAFEFNGSTYIGNEAAGFLGFSAGKSLWFHSDNVHSPVLIAGGSAVTQDSFGISLSAGWNMIGNPYQSAVPWATPGITVQTGEGPRMPLTLKIYEYRQGIFVELLPNNNEIIQPFTGYAIHADQPCTLVFSKP